MSDIVERLLNPTRMVVAGDACAVLAEDQTSADMKEAAAEIVRLRATIEQLRSVAGAVNMESPAFSAIKKEIRG